MKVWELLLDAFTRDRRGARICERHGEVRQTPVQAETLRGMLHCQRLRSVAVRLAVERILLGPEHLLGAAVMQRQVVVCHWPRFALAPRHVVDEPILVLANEDVGVDEGTTPEAA